MTPDRFADDLRSQGSELQNALARAGARHLYESEEVLPSSTGDDLQRIIGDTLGDGDPRLVAALGPVLVTNIDRVALSKVQLELSRAGFERRLPWLCENLGEAVNSELKANPPRTWAKGARRTDLILKLFLTAASPPSDRPPAEWDALDAGIRTMKTAIDVQNAASAIARKWRIITSLTPEDFARALRDARASHP